MHQAHHSAAQVFLNENRPLGRVALSPQRCVRESCVWSVRPSCLGYESFTRVERFIARHKDTPVHGKLQTVGGDAPEARVEPRVKTTANALLSPVDPRRHERRNSQLVRQQPQSSGDSYIRPVRWTRDLISCLFAVRVHEFLTGIRFGSRAARMKPTG